ncbi:hypothetical protein [Paenibacillus sanguinis]|uniref:hypothetical protein n=1 Tax=Paenibacillus sanguinis TaxID=225906 RepID=UPI00036DE156|nr:hypothetical protein [Paenibacillus sanguinis]
MNSQKMTGELKPLYRQMNPDNQAYFNQMLEFIYSDANPLPVAKGEELLVDLARQVVHSQSKGVSAADLFGDDPNAYCEQLVDDMSRGKPRTLGAKIRYYIMIPWVALTWIFFIYMITGFFSKWFSGSMDYVVISSSSLLIMAGLSIVLIELVTRFLANPGRTEQESTQAGDSANRVPHRPAARSFNLRSFGLYIGIAVGVILIGALLNRIMPSFTVSPWDSLIIFVVGLAGQFFFFSRRSKL